LGWRWRANARGFLSVSTADIATNMDYQMPCQKRLSISASHSAYFSRPDELTQTLLMS
jgi:hypothetical protein